MMMTTSTALALGILVSKPTSLDAFMVNLGPRAQHRCSTAGDANLRCSGDEWVGTRSPLAAASHPIRSRSAAAGRSSGTGLGTVSMSLAEWKEQRRNSPPRHGSGQKNLLDDFTHVKGTATSYDSTPESFNAEWHPYRATHHFRRKAIKGGVAEFMSVIDESLSGELVTVMTYMPWCRSCKHTRQRLRTLAESHAAAGSGAQFYEMDLSANPAVHEMLDIHAAPTVLLYMSGQLVDEFVCGGDNGSKTLLRHVEAQIGPEPPRP